MEVFSVFATLSLADLVSSPLNSIRSSMNNLGGNVTGLGARMGNLALAMAPVALAAGVLLGAFGLAASKAIAFESAMADVAKVVNFDSQAEFAAMSDTVKELAGRIPMAADGIAAIIAAAGQSGVAKQDLTEFAEQAAKMGVAFDLTGDQAGKMMTEFAEQAAKMGVAFDLTGDQAGKMMADWRAGMNLSLPKVYALADAVNHLSNNMNANAPALGEVIQRVGAAAMACGLAETDVAALGAAFLSAGASPEIAATALKKFTTTLVKGTAMSKEQAAAFQGLGFSVTQMAKDMQTDAQGTIFKVLQAIADKPKELQMSLLTEMFGEEAIGAIAPLLQNMGNLTQAFDLVGDASNYAGSMQAEFDTRSKTTANALRLLSNKLTNLAISVGTVFLPAVSAGANFLGMLADGLRLVAETPFGQWLLEVVASVSALVIGLAALSAGMWFFAAAGPMLAKVLGPACAALTALGAPFWVLIAVAGALYLAFKTNFAGVADTLGRWWKNTTLVVKGVLDVFRSLTGGVGEIKGELAKDIKAAGLEGLVTAVSHIVYRIQKFFAGMAAGMAPALAAIDEILLPARLAIASFMLSIESLFGDVNSTVGGSVGTWEHFGQVVGNMVGWAMEAVATAIALGVNALQLAGNMIGWFASLLNGDWDGACASAVAIWNILVNAFMSVADLFRIGDWLRTAMTDALNYLDSIDLFESGAKILTTLANGIKSAVMVPFSAVSDAFTRLRNLLPFSDAKEGPLSALTLSGTRIMSTLGEGVTAGAGALFAKVTGALGTVGETIGSWWDELFGASSAPLALSAHVVPQREFVTIPDAPAFAPGTAHNQQSGQSQGRNPASNITINISNLNLPNVTDKASFAEEMQSMTVEYNGVPA